MNNSEFAEAVLDLEKEPTKVKFEQAKNHGVREIRIALNRVPLTITAENAKKPQQIYGYWRNHLA